MGRPLYSASSIIRASAIATTPPDVTIRTVPDMVPDHPEIRQWSYWNAFDPDADDFFEGPDAVYEAFVDPSTLPPLREEAASEEEVDARRRRRTSEIDLIAALAMGPSDASSEGTSSGRTSPSIRQSYTLDLDDAPRASMAEQAGPDGDDTAVIVVRNESPTPSLTIRRVVIPASVPDAGVARPVTPPLRPSSPSHVTPLVYTPSPPPTVTPRIFTWSRRNSYPISPLPNHGARMSVAHISRTHVTAILNSVHG